MIWTVFRKHHIQQLLRIPVADDGDLARLSQREIKRAKPIRKARRRRAERTPDRARRLAMYREADRIWVDEQALVVPLFYASEWMSLVKPWVKGYAVSPLSQVMFKNITIEK